MTISTLITSVVKAGPEDEPERSSGHGSNGRIGRTNGRTGDVIIEKNIIFKYINIEPNYVSLIS